MEIFPLNPEVLDVDVVLIDPAQLEPVHFVQRDYQHCHGLDIRFAQAQTAWMEERARKHQDMLCEVAKIAAAAYELHREQEPPTIYQRPTVEPIPQGMGCILPTEQSRGPPSCHGVGGTGGIGGHPPNFPLSLKKSLAVSPVALYLQPIKSEINQEYQKY